MPTIVGELKRYFRDYGWMVRVPRPAKERVLVVNRTVERLTPALGRPPTPREIAADAGLTLEQVLESMATAAAARPASLDASARGEDGDRRGFGDCLGYEDEALRLIECRDTVSRSLRGLSPREHQVLYLRFVEDLTQAEIARQIGVSQMQVSRIVRRALERSRETAERCDLPAAGG